MLALSGLIALFGLLQNSVAVIIDAMLISPLMNPILAGALALLLGDGRLGEKAAIILGISIGGVIVITGIVAWLSPLKEVTPEILARTNPNLLDLFIAFLSGLAGTLALRSGSTNLTIIPGVAIAVAVVPPLALKAAQERITSYLQKQVDDLLLGTPIRRQGPVQAQLGENRPVVLNLLLTAPQPLEDQTAKLLAGQLAAKISLPVEVHGEVELQGAGYAMTLELPSNQSRFHRKIARR